MVKQDSHVLDVADEIEGKRSDLSRSGAKVAMASYEAIVFVTYCVVWMPTVTCQWRTARRILAHGRIMQPDQCARARPIIQNTSLRAAAIAVCLRDLLSIISPMSWF